MYFRRILATAAICAFLGFTLIVVATSVRADDDDEDNDAAPAHVVVVDGRVRIRLDGDDEARLGIVTAASVAHRHVEEASAVARVVAIDELLDTRQAVRRARVAVRSAAAMAATQRAAVERFVQLRRDGLSIDTSAYAAEQRDLQARQATLAAAELALEQLYERAKFTWGDRLGAAVRDDDPLIDDLFERRRVLVSVFGRSADASTWRGAGIWLDPEGRRDAARPAVPLGPSTLRGDATVPGVFAVTAGEGLVPGMRLAAWQSAGDGGVEGVLVPRAAAFWHAGRQWIYVRTGAGEFERRELGNATPIGDHWFLRAGLGADENVVAEGATTLLGEEFRWSIPDEDDD